MQQLPQLPAGARATLWLVRHGEVNSPGPEKVYGDLEMPLSERGKAQAVAVAEWLRGEKLDAVYSSDLERARFGAERIVERQGLDCRRAEDRGFREIFRGRWRGRTWQEIRTEQPDGPEQFLSDPCGYRGHDGETLADVDARALAALGRLIDAESSSAERRGPMIQFQAAIVSHSWTLRALTARALELPLEAVMQMPLETAGTVVLGFDGGWKVRSIRSAPRVVENTGAPQARSHG